MTGRASDAATALREAEATWSAETEGLLCLYVYAPGRRKAAPVAATKHVSADVQIDYDEAGGVLGVEVITNA